MTCNANLPDQNKKRIYQEAFCCIPSFLIVHKTSVDLGSELHDNYCLKTITEYTTFLRKLLSFLAR